MRKLQGINPKIIEHYFSIILLGFFPWCPSIFYIMCGHLFFRLISDQPMGETQRVATVATTLKKPTPQNTSQLKINVSLSDFILIFRTCRTRPTYILWVFIPHCISYLNVIAWIANTLLITRCLNDYVSLKMDSLAVNKIV